MSHNNMVKTSPELQQEINNEFAELSRRQSLLPIKVSNFYRKKIEEEITSLGHTEGPLHRAVYPSRERLLTRAPLEVPDFVDDRKHMQNEENDFIVRKYADRILFFPTNNCISNCQYCFRQDILSETRNGHIHKTVRELLEKLVEYANLHPEIEEIILSGGDPLSLPFQTLKEIMEEIKKRTAVESIRIHTRSIIFYPQVFTPDKMALMGDYNIRLVTHIIHPYEICKDVEAVIKKLHLYKVRLYNQFPLLRKINDHSQVLIKFLKLLDELAIRNLSIFIPDPINYSAAFRIPLERIFSIIDEVNWNSPSWINSTRFTLDTKHGKVRRDNLKSYNQKDQIAIFERAGKIIIYPDLPAHLDEPGDLKTLLWKDNI